MGFGKKVFSITLALAFGVVAIGSVSVPKVEAATVKLNKTKASIKVGSKLTLKVNGTSKKVSWKSSKADVAKVSKKGVVTGIKAGKAVVSAKVAGKTYKCNVTVKSGYDDLKKFLKKKGELNKDTNTYWNSWSKDDTNRNCEFGYNTSGDDLTTEYVYLFSWSTEPGTENDLESAYFTVFPNGGKVTNNLYVDHYIIYENYKTGVVLYSLMNEDGDFNWFDWDFKDVSDADKKAASEFAKQAVSDWKEILDDVIKIPFKSITDVFYN